MILIPVKKNEGIVSIKISINGTITWDYNYYEDQSYHNDSILNNRKEHVLGLPHDLKTIKHKWNFIVVNPSSNKIKVDIEIVWEQIQNNTPFVISKWNINKFEIPANEPRDFSDEGYIVKS